GLFFIFFGIAAAVLALCGGIWMYSIRSGNPSSVQATAPEKELTATKSIVLPHPTEKVRIQPTEKISPTPVETEHKQMASHPASIQGSLAGSASAQSIPRAIPHVPASQVPAENQGKQSFKTDSPSDSKTNRTSIPAPDVLPRSGTSAAVTRTDSIIPKPSGSDSVVSARLDSLPPKADSTAHNPAPPLSSPSRMGVWSLFLHAGINWQLPSSLSPLYGISLSRDLGPHYKIGAGLSYTTLQGAAGIPSSSSSKTYRYDSLTHITDSTTTTATFKRNAGQLQYLTMPVFIRYNGGKSTHVVLGANIYYLLRSTYSTTQTILVNGQEQSSTTLTLHAIPPGYLRYDIGLWGGLEQDIWKRFSAGLYFNYGLLQISGKNSGNGPAMKNNSVQFILRYNLFNW
ncbi:MAG TPA: outer membrane beta-barrel protein, partial [Bacteroidia bacterium]|nr:outer membrane beta-barrel protein [Bacteroidia bacterium]